MGQPHYDQVDWAIGDNDASTSNDPDTCTFVACHTSDGKAKDVVFMVRITVENNGDKNGDSDPFMLWANDTTSPSTGNIFRVTTSTAGGEWVVMADGTDLADGDACDAAQCTGQITVTSGFQSGFYCEAADTQTDGIALAQDKYTEIQFAVKLTDAGATIPATTYFFARVNNAVCDAYTGGPAQVTLASGPAALTKNVWESLGLATGLD